MSYNIKVSNPLYDVNTCDDKDLSFTGEGNLLKVKLEGDYSITIPGGQDEASITIYHNLGYEPAVLVFGKRGYETSFRQRLPITGRVGFQRHFCDIYADRIVITAIDSCPVTDQQCFNRIANPRIFTGHYYIFIDPLPS